MGDAKVTVTIATPEAFVLSVVERTQPGAAKIIDVYVDTRDAGEHPELAAGRECQLDPSRAIEVCPKCGSPLVWVSDHRRFVGIDRETGEHRKTSLSGGGSGPIEPPAADSHNGEDGNA
jgi:hypothetical protein